MVHNGAHFQSSKWMWSSLPPISTCHFCNVCTESLEDMWLEKKKRSNIYLGDYGVKELVINCAHVHFSLKNGPAASLLKGQGSAETHVKKIKQIKMSDLH